MSNKEIHAHLLQLVLKSPHHIVTYLSHPHPFHLHTIHSQSYLGRAKQASRTYKALNIRCIVPTLLSKSFHGPKAYPRVQNFYILRERVVVGPEPPSKAAEGLAIHSLPLTSGQAIKIQKPKE